MENISNTLAEQFTWEPAIVGTPPAAAPAVVGGMGGSHLAADLLAHALPSLGLSAHHDYGLPQAIPAGSMAVAVSHSGNTEETLDFIQAAHAQSVPAAAISTGGKLIEFAATQGIAHVVLPHSTLPPRSCVGYHAVALLTLLGRTQELAALRAAAQTPAMPHAQFVAHLGDGVALVYASQKNAALAEYIKVQLNETAQVPAFVGTFPELNHNEMVATLSSAASRVVLLRDPSDDPRILRRMDAFAALAAERSIAALPLDMPGEPLARLVAGVALAQALSAELAAKRQVDPSDASIIEDFKKRII